MIARYALQRLLQSIPTVLVVTMVVFSLVLLIPGDPVLMMLGYVTDEPSVVSDEVYDAMKLRLGLDKPLPLQYLQWLGRAVQGDLGNSIINGQPVMDLILQRLPATLYLAVAAFLLALLIAIPGGVWAAVRQNSWVDHLASSFVLTMICVPGFWLALLLVLAFSIKVSWFPSIGYVAPQENLSRFLLHLTLPAVVLGLEMAANVMRFVRNEFIEQIRQDYVRTARAKGLPERLVIWKHTLKNSMVATITVLGFQATHLLGGSTIIENVFAYPGISYLMVQSIFARDFPVVQGVALMLALVVVVVNLLVDLLYALFDPRIRYD